MIMQAEEKKIYTSDEYLDFEVNSGTRHEYINGEIIPITGGTPEHNEIVSILNAALRVALKGKPYSLYTYPDVMVVPRPLQRQQGRTDTITNPIMIAEVLSKSTKSYDRDEKFSAYRTMPSFQEYLLVDRYSIHAEQYFKTDSHQWIFTEYNDAESLLSLSSIPFEIPLADLYENVELEP